MAGGFQMRLGPRSLLSATVIDGHSRYNLALQARGRMSSECVQERLTTAAN
jgi:hypothetical protein